jgi:hypothetical protein
MLDLSETRQMNDKRQYILNEINEKQHEKDDQQKQREAT